MTLPVVAIFGPTGVGKTGVAVELADLLRERGEDPVAVSADALQVYRGLGTLTGAATPDQQRRLEHRLVGFVEVRDEFSAGAYMPLAHAEIDAALAKGRRPLVVGGTGLYLRAALADLDLRPSVPVAVRARLERAVEVEGAPALHARLRERAPRAAAAMAPTDRSRIVRALELLEAGEAPPARGDESRLWTTDTRHPTVLIGLTMGREALYARIDARMEKIAAEAEDEVRAAAAAGASRTARAALGFDELLAGDVEAMKRQARNYAKRQITWMGKHGAVESIDVTDADARATAARIAAVAVS